MQKLEIHWASGTEETFWFSQNYESHYPTLWAVSLQTGKQVSGYLEAIHKLDESMETPFER